LASGNLLLANQKKTIMDESMYREMALHAVGVFRPLSESLKDNLRSVLKVETFGKGKLILKCGSVCDRMHYIVKGLIHCYYGTRENPETDYFMVESHFAISKYSFYEQKISDQSIEAMEETITVSISYTDLEMLYIKYPLFNYNGRKLTEQYHVKSNIKTLVLRPKRAVDRYDLFKKLAPELTERVTGKFLSAFLGVREETLSRMKRKEKKTYVNRTRKKDINIDLDQSEHCN
jgi:CRP/FNR family transcriptional regulator, anaerobic regulatory protein